MRKSLTAVDKSIVSASWVDVLERKLVDELGEAEDGHCLRVSDLPRFVLESLALRLTSNPIAGASVFLVDRQAGPESWRVGIHKVVERRNFGEGALVALFPPDVQLAAGDSVDVSTFRSVPVGGLDREVEEELIGQIAEPLQKWVRNVLEYLGRRWSISTTSRLTFLATIAAQERSDLEVIGGALFALGLIPDFELLTRPDEFQLRIGQRNIPLVNELRADGATPIQRILSLPLTDESFRNRLFEFFRDRPTDRVPDWGASIATDPSFLDLSLDCWPLEEGAQPTGQLRIDIEDLKLPRRTEDGVLVLDAASKFVVAWQTSPPPIDVPGLAFFRIEILSSDRVAVWESPLIKNSAGKSPRRSRTIKNLLGLDAGVYFARVTALNAAGDPFPEQDLRDPESATGGKRTNESDDFLLVESEDDISVELDDIEAVTNISVAGFAEAELLARWAALNSNRDPLTVQPKALEWITPLDARGELASATIRFDLQHQYSVRLSQKLRRLELNILDMPSESGHFLMRSTPYALESRPFELPSRFRLVRESLFELICQTQLAGDGNAVVALTDLCGLKEPIEAYADAYLDWMRSGDTNALRVDVVLVEIPEHGTAALMAPTHPLRVLWMLQEQSLARNWVSTGMLTKNLGASAIDAWRMALSPEGIPPVLVLDEQEQGYIDSGPLVGGWEAYLPTRLHDSRAMLALLRSRLGIGPAHKSEADVSPKILADKLQLFLRQHPYTSTLVMNVINPGDAALVVDALVELETRLENTPSVRYIVRLFTDSTHREGIGDAFRDLIDPTRQISEAADRLTAPGRSYLFPKLTWSRNRLQEFLENPEGFPSHITLLLDVFPVTLRVVRGHNVGRSSFVHGLKQEAPRRFVGRGTSYSWVRRAAPSNCVDLPEAPGRSELLALLLRTTATLQAKQLAPLDAHEDTSTVAALDLSVAGQSLLYSAHAVSTWVLTLDPNLGLDYFDSSRRKDRPGYLLDFTPEFTASGGRQLLLTTRIGDEVAQIMAPATSQIDLDPEGPGGEMIMEALRSLSGRLALRLLSAPSQVQGALGMALSRMFLESNGILERAIVIPLDAHPELSERPADLLTPRLRGDLLVVTADAGRRELSFLLIETKCHSGSGIGPSLREEITGQLAASESALLEAFAPALHDPDRIDRVLQSWKLAGVLNFYLDRAVRYDLVDAAEAHALRLFFDDLEAGYVVSTRKLGLVFHLDSDETRLDQTDPDLPIWLVGGPRSRELATEALRRFLEPQSEDPPLGTRRVDEILDSSERQSFRASLHLGDSKNVSHPVDTASASQGNPAEPPTQPSLHGETEIEPTDKDGILDAAAIQVPNFDVFLGESAPTSQFGILGRIAAEPWRTVAVDLNGCNTFAVLGVQGSGKSYTVGSLVEMAAKRLPNLNELPAPLATIVFHYHQTQDYPPEFVSMRHAAEDPEQVSALAEWGGIPDALEDVVLLTTADTLERRRAEFPGMQVEPIKFSSQELTVADWRFLMGAAGNDALYLKLLNEVMRASRDNLSLQAIRDGLLGSGLTDSQRSLAETRLNFAARFIDDERSLRSLVRPGRLILVDLRDEFVEREQALGLFMTMLNVFSGAGMGPERFNKLIVMDEAHKYVGGALIRQVVELVREMRHKGVSVVLASQDPVNLPSEVLELSSCVVLHRFNSPSWLKHIQKSLAALTDLTPAMLSALNPGEAFLWANKATESIFTRRAVKLRMRPRVTMHGGSTRTAQRDDHS